MGVCYETIKVEHSANRHPTQAVKYNTISL